MTNVTHALDFVTRAIFAMHETGDLESPALDHAMDALMEAETTLKEFLNEPR